MSSWQNMGTLDRTARAVLGIVLGAIAGFGGVAMPWTAVLGVVAVLLLGTATVGFCPAYLPFGLRTCAAPRQGGGAKAA